MLSVLRPYSIGVDEQDAPDTGTSIASWGTQYVEHAAGGMLMEPVHADGTTPRLSLLVLVDDGEQCSAVGSAAA
jgi:hypothetical protein